MLPARAVPCCAVLCVTQVRMQSEGKKAAGEPKKYANAFKAYGIIARCERRQHVLFLCVLTHSAHTRALYHMFQHTCGRF